MKHSKTGKRFIILILFFSMALLTFGQAPGYMGKNFIVSYDIYAFPAFTNPNANGQSGITAFNFRHAISVDYVTSLNKSFGLSFHHTKTQFEFERTFYYSYTDNSSSYPYLEYLVDYDYTQGDISSLAFGLHTNLYFNQFIAPLGTYFKPELLLVNFKATFDPEEANKNLAENIGSNYTTYPTLATKNSYTTVALGATVGTHYILFDHFIFNIGFQFGWLVGGKKLSDLGDMDTSPGNIVSEDNYIPVSGKARLNGQYLFNITTGIGFLIF